MVLARLVGSRLRIAEEFATMVQDHQDHDGPAQEINASQSATDEGDGKVSVAASGRGETADFITRPLFTGGLVAVRTDHFAAVARRQGLVNPQVRSRGRMKTQYGG